MKTPAATAAARSGAGDLRHRVLEQMLRERRRELQTVIRRRVRQAPAVGEVGGLDDTEYAEADVQEHIELALVQIKGEALKRIEESMVRLAAGEYGFCAECQGEISERRLRAVPFAVRCTACEEAHEARAAAEQRSLARQRDSMAWAEPAGS